MGYLKLEVKILKENYVFLLIGLFAAIVGDILVFLRYFERNLVNFDSTKGSQHLVKELGSFGDLKLQKRVEKVVTHTSVGVGKAHLQYTKNVLSETRTGEARQHYAQPSVFH